MVELLLSVIFCCSIEQSEQKKSVPITNINNLI